MDNQIYICFNRESNSVSFIVVCLWKCNISAKFVPKKTVFDKNTPPWIDREVKYLIKKKYTALRRYRLTQEVKDMIKRKHEDYLVNAKHSFADNPKLFWSYHKAIHLNKQQSSIITHGDIITTTNREKFNLFNSYLSSIFQPRSDWNCFELSYAYESVMQISEIQLETNEVYECLRTLDTTKACWSLTKSLLAS